MSWLEILVVIGVVAHAVTYDFWIGSDPLPYGLVLFPLVTLAALLAIVGTVAGIYFSSEPAKEGEEVQQWARVKFSHGIRTVPAGSIECTASPIAESSKVAA